jgi:hypothetical protein
MVDCAIGCDENSIVLLFAYRDEVRGAIAMTDRLEEIRKRCAGASNGPWAYDKVDGVVFF